MAAQEKTDWQLIVGISSGDVSSYEDAYRRYYPRLLSFVKGLIKDAARAEDLAQNVFMKLWYNRSRLDPNLSLRNYLFVTARNEVIDFLRSKAHTAMSYPEELPEIARPGERAEEVAEYHETNSAVARIVGDMPERRRVVFQMSRYQHKSVEEISRELDLSPRTVEKHIELALKDLRKTLN
ncbi:MAG: RNA polymerase sigma-70 factor [Bacteroidales bacterium]|nr:RNA polymerase sigma-70 factor [Bacteroidales bacterium]